MTVKSSDIRIATEKFPEKEYTTQIESLYPFASKISPYPVVINTEFLDNFNKIGNILHSVLITFVYNYFRDINLQQLYNLEDELVDILKIADGIPYEIGMYRMNFILDTHGHPRITEINGQNPTKNWFLSRSFQTIGKQFAENVNPEWNFKLDSGDFLDEIDNLFDKEEVLYIVRTNKISASENTTTSMLKSNGIDAIYVTPNDFIIEGGELKIGEDLARQFFLEMNAEELKLFNKEVLERIVRSGRCLNDVRTIILVHHKKVMAGLFNPNIMRSYANQEEFEFLKKYLIPSFIIKEQQDLDFLHTTSENWVLKTNTSEEDFNISIRQNYTSEAWSELINEKWKDLLVQPVIKQKELHLETENIKTPINLIGQQLYFNAKFYGLGFFRASKELNTINYKDNILLSFVTESND